MNPILTRALWAALPLLSLALDAKGGLLYGGMGAGIFLSALLIFFLIHLAIPEFLHRISFFLLLVVLGVKAIDFFLGGVNAFAFLLPAGLWLLTHPDLFRRRRNWNRIVGKNLLTALSFWILLAGHGILSELLRERMGIRLFHGPAGSYFLMGLAMTFLPQRMKK